MACSGSPTRDMKRKEKAKVKVCVRLRPFDKRKSRHGIQIDGEKLVVKSYEKKRYNLSCMKGKDCFKDELEFKVDYVQDDSKLGGESKEESQRRMYDAVGAECVDIAMDGFNTTVMAYGQTGAGKTFTMNGDGSEEGKGLVPRLGIELIKRLNNNKDNGKRVTIQVSYLEIYQEKIRDLLPAPAGKGPSTRNSYSQEKCDEICSEGTDGDAFSTCSDLESWSSTSQQDVGDVSGSEDKFHVTKSLEKKSLNRVKKSSLNSCRSPSNQPCSNKEFLRVREHPVTGPYVEGLTWHPVSTWSEMENLFNRGSLNRTTGATNKNCYSSRSHALFSFKISWVNHDGMAVNYINLVDLAGSEKVQSGTNMFEKMHAESRCINKSLTLLNEVILNLSKSNFVSYRNSVLTWLLKESLGGNSKTFMVANVSADGEDVAESVRTLRYATRANIIRNSVSPVELDSRDLTVMQLKQDVGGLENKLHDKEEAGTHCKNTDVDLNFSADCNDLFSKKDALKESSLVKCFGIEDCRRLYEDLSMENLVPAQLPFALEESFEARVLELRCNSCSRLQMEQVQKYSMRVVFLLCSACMVLNSMHLNKKAGVRTRYIDKRQSCKGVERILFRSSAPFLIEFKQGQTGDWIVHFLQAGVNYIGCGSEILQIKTGCSESDQIPLQIIYMPGEGCVEKTAFVTAQATSRNCELATRVNGEFLSGCKELHSGDRIDLKMKNGDFKVAFHFFIIVI